MFQHLIRHLLLNHIHHTSTPPWNVAYQTIAQAMHTSAISAYRSSTKKKKKTREPNKQQLLLLPLFATNLTKKYKRTLTKDCSSWVHKWLLNIITNHMHWNIKRTCPKICQAISHYTTDEQDARRTITSWSNVFIIYHLEFIKAECVTSLYHSMIT
jgi:hypothetical protein